MTWQSVLAIDQKDLTIHSFAMFALLNLPSLPMEQIIKEMELIDIFHFSLLSKRCAFAVQRANVKVDEVTWSFEEYKREIYVTDRKKECTEFKICFYFGDCPNGIERFYTSCGVRTNSVEHIAKPTECLLGDLSAHFLKVFKTDRFLLYSKGTLPSLPVFWPKWNLHFEHFTFHWSSLKDVISHETCKFLLDNIKSDSLHFNHKVAPGFQYSEPFKHKELNIKNADWFTLDNLLNNECEELSVEGSNITTSDLKVFSEKWKEGCFPNLKSLRYSFPNDHRDINIPIMERDEKGRQIVTDVNRNRGTITYYYEYQVNFRVNLQDDCSDSE